MLITTFFVIKAALACARKFDDDLLKSKEKIELLENVLESRNQTINLLRGEVDRKNEDIVNKEKVLEENKIEKSEMLNKWNAADGYIKHMHSEFLKEVAKVRRLETSKSATDAVLKALVTMEENNRSFFERIMDKVTHISDKQTTMLQNTQATHKETLSVLQNIVAMNNEMKSTLEKYNSNQGELMMIIDKMTVDEMELWNMVKSLRSVIAALEEEQKAQISEMLDKQGERTRLLIASVLNLVSQQEIWKQLNNDTLSENLEKLQIVKFAISEGLKIIDNENATLAMNLKFNFENKLTELKDGINWKENQTIGEWVNEPNVRMKITKDLRNSAMKNLQEISLDGLSNENLAEAQRKLESLRSEIVKQDIELEDLIEKKIEIKKMKQEYKTMNTNHSSLIDEIRQENFNITIDGGEEEVPRTDRAYAKAITDTERNSISTRGIGIWAFCGVVICIAICVAYMIRTRYIEAEKENNVDGQNQHQYQREPFLE